MINLLRNTEELETAGFTYLQARTMLSIWIDIAGQIPLKLYEN